MEKNVPLKFNVFFFFSIGATVYLAFKSTEKVVLCQWHYDGQELKWTGYFKQGSHNIVFIDLPFIVRCKVGFIKNFTDTTKPEYRVVVFYSIAIYISKVPRSETCSLLLICITYERLVLMFSLHLVSVVIVITHCRL